VFIKEKGMVEVILQVWVDMLYYASYRCSKESHAKQLADGSEELISFSHSIVVSIFLMFCNASPLRVHDIESKTAPHRFYQKSQKPEEPIDFQYKIQFSNFGD
jgi:hypothetical protein